MTEGTRVWIVDDDRSIRWVLEKALGRENIAAKSFGSADEALAALGFAVAAAGPNRRHRATQPTRRKHNTKTHRHTRHTHMNNNGPQAKTMRKSEQNQTHMNNTRNI